MPTLEVTEYAIPLWRPYSGHICRANANCPLITCGSSNAVNLICLHLREQTACVADPEKSLRKTLHLHVLICRHAGITFLTFYLTNLSALLAG